MKSIVSKMFLFCMCLLACATAFGQQYPSQDVPPTQITELAQEREYASDKAGMVEALVYLIEVTNQDIADLILRVRPVSKAVEFLQEWHNIRIATPVRTQAEADHLFAQGDQYAESAWRNWGIWAGALEYQMEEFVVVYDESIYYAGLAKSCYRQAYVKMVEVKQHNSRKWDELIRLRLRIEEYLRANPPVVVPDTPIEL